MRLIGSVETNDHASGSRVKVGEIPNLLKRLSTTRLNKSIDIPSLTGAVNKKSNGFMGVDIGARRVQLLEFSDGRHPRVNGFGSARLADQAVVDDIVADVDAVGNAVKNALRKSGISSRNAAVAVSGPGVIIKMIELPVSLGDEEIEEQIHYDAEAYIPHPIEEVHLDFRVVEPDPNKPSVNRVMLAACRRETVATYIEALKKGGVSVEIVDLASIALQNACNLLIDGDNSHYEGATYAVFDVRGEQTRLTVQSNGKSVYSRELTLATGSMIESLVSQYEVLDEGELFERMRDGTIDAGMIANDVAEFATNAAAQIEQTLQFFTSAAAFHETIDEVIVTGDIGLFPGIEAALVQHLDRPLRLGNPISHLPASNAAQKKGVEWYGPALAIASGLAIRSVR